MDNLCIRKIHQLFRAVVDFERILDERFSLNINELMLLCLLSERDCLLAGEIANYMNLTRSNASKVIASLERKGCIERKACSHDSRCQQCQITKAGKMLIEKINNEDFEGFSIMKI